MFTSISLINFKSYRKATLPLAPLTLLIGANASGKSNARKLRALITTHNPALLDALPPAAIPDVVCCYRDPERGDSRLIRLEEVRSYPVPPETHASQGERQRRYVSASSAHRILLSNP